MAGVVICLLSICLSCKTSKTEIVYGEIENGNQLDRVTEIELDTFLTIWTGRTDDERGLSVKQLYKDSAFTYFWVRWKDYYKLRNEILAKVNYESVNGDEIRSDFYNQIITADDKYKQDRCVSSWIDFDWEYDFREQANCILIRCHYKVKCEALIRVVNRQYQAKYDITSGVLTKIINE